MGVLRGEFQAGFEDSSCSSSMHVSKSGRERGETCICIAYLHINYPAHHST